MSVPRDGAVMPEIFLHLVHPENMSPKSMSAKEVSESLPAHGFSVPDLYPERVYDDSHDEGYDSA